MACFCGMAVIDTDPGFDMLACAKKLEGDGVEEKRAGACATRFRRRRLAVRDNLEARLETEIERAANRILPAIMAPNAVLFAAMKFL